jgi:hypothetical protein
VKRDVDRLDATFRHPHRATRVRVDTHHVGIGAEATARVVDDTHLVFEHGARDRERVRVVHDERRGRAERGKRGRGGGHETGLRGCRLCGGGHSIRRHRK